ncbi:hypothetical protein [Natrinema halophilum]|uniref:hypothetical protein n=1 Tax=Natrinema halophilum TaxID=1699371 RepID=UPI001F3CE297|nr:hypothetical protein [Natrinema halophilum]UHQ95969.1 hypothetical protein HYG82_21055 [Natrinema halophilum]
MVASLSPPQRALEDLEQPAETIEIEVLTNGFATANWRRFERTTSRTASTGRHLVRGGTAQAESDTVRLLED